MDYEEPIVEHVGTVEDPPIPQTYPPEMPAQGDKPPIYGGNPPSEEFIGTVGILIFMDKREEAVMSADVPAADSKTVRITADFSPEAYGMLNEIRRRLGTSNAEAIGGTRRWNDSALSARRFTAAFRH